MGLDIDLSVYWSMIILFVVMCNFLAKLRDSSMSLANTIACRYMTPGFSE